MVIRAVVLWRWVINGDLFVSLILMIPGWCLWSGRRSSGWSVVFLSGSVLQSAVISGSISMGWRSVVRCVAVVAVGTRASVTWTVAMGRSVERSGATSMRVLVATTPIAVVTGLGLTVTKSRSVPVVMAWASGVAVTSRGRSPTPVVGVSPVAGWCTWWEYLIWAVHGDMSIIITVVAPYVWAVACHMTDFLALKAPIIITWHSADWWSG